MPKKKTTPAKKKDQGRPTAAPRTKRPHTHDTADHHFAMVGLGASAGGLEALRAFFAEVAPDSGMAYIVVVHLHAKQPSLMPELLQKVAPVPVLVAADGLTIEPDHIYVAPPSKEISVFHGKIQLLDMIGHPKTLPIDHFLRSLAQDQGSRAVGVILSGTGTDGTLGVRAIKSGDGLVLAQSEESAGYSGMPRSAINSGVVDRILAPQEMPPLLSQYFTHHTLALADKPAGGGDPGNWLNKIFAILRAQVGHDFSPYKVNTLLRRIGRRMGLNQIENHELYVRLLQEKPDEAEALFRELLIGVTNFFRDAESFEILKTRVLPELFDRLPQDATFRAWIPGCSTGEEVYSLAMVIREVLDKHPKPIKFQLFGTDIDGYAIDKAREGLYPVSISADVSPERLQRFFSQEGDFFRISKDIRGWAVFSEQDLIKDPPFSRLHLLCCRNLMIYLDSPAQKKILPLFHYTLVPQGVLMLGSSESIGGFAKLFQPLDKKWKIYRRLEVSQTLKQQIVFPSGLSTPAGGREAATLEVPKGREIDIAQMTRRALLEQFAPTALLIDPGGNILHVQGRTGKYLETPSGPPTQNILDMARQGLRIELSSAIRAAKASNQPVLRRKIGVKTNGTIQMIDLHVSPQHVPHELAGHLLVVFQDIDPAPASDAHQDSPDHQPRESARIAELEKELQSTRESHQSTIEELESSNEELKSANEELHSSNEEMQSTNEELESSREELQSLNEELQTVNAELQSKVDELSAAQDDMRNLLNSTEIATIFVDNHMRVRRFTLEATAIINLIQSDIGRPLRHVATNLKYAKLISDLQEVLQNLIPCEAEVQAMEGHWYKMRIIPYRTTDNRIDGAVLTFASINEQKQAQSELQETNKEMKQASQLVRNVFDMNEDPLAVIDRNGMIVIANTAFTDVMKIPSENVAKMNIFKIKNGLLSGSGLKTKLKDAAQKGENFQIEAGDPVQSKTIGTCFIKGRIMRAEADLKERILLRFMMKR